MRRDSYRLIGCFAGAETQRTAGAARSNKDTTLCNSAQISKCLQFTLRDRHIQARSAVAKMFSA